MFYKINCTYGELIDKLTNYQILVANEKNNNNKQLYKLEIEELMKHYETDNIKLHFLYNELSNINKKLFVIKGILSNTNVTQVNIEIYKQYTELEKNRSKLKDEITFMTIQNYNMNNIKNYPEQTELSEAIELYQKQEIEKSHSILSKLSDKYKDDDSINDFLIQVYFSLITSGGFVGEEYKYIDKLTRYIKSDFFKHHPNVDMKIAFIIGYGNELLTQKKYQIPLNYIYYLQKVEASGPNIDIKPETMSYFKKNDENKTLLIYMAGGIGDKLMHSRFIPRICEENEKNKIMFMVDDELCWIYKELYGNMKIPNLLVLQKAQVNMLATVYRYDYHMNVTFLFNCLNLRYDDIYINYWDTSDLIYYSNFKVDSIIDKNKRNIVINWHGNYASPHEFVRGIELKKLIPLFELENNINWISVQKTVSEKEREILQKYNIHDLSDKIDMSMEKNSFEDTIKIFNSIDLLISTDTSLVHLAGSMNIPCWCLLYIGCDWRWTRNDKTTKWYPNIKIIRQNKFNCWDNVIETTVEELQKF